MEWDRNDLLNASTMHVHIPEQRKTIIKWEKRCRASKIQLNILVAAPGQISLWFYISANYEIFLKSLEMSLASKVSVRDSRESTEPKLHLGNFQLLFFCSHTQCSK